MSDDKFLHSYGHEKLYLAVRFLATGTGTIQQRLESVATSWLGLDSFKDLLPATLMSELTAIIHELTKVSGDDGAIRATALAMSDEEGKELAARVLDLYIDLRKGI